MFRGSWAPATTVSIPSDYTLLSEGVEPQRMTQGFFFVHNCCGMIGLVDPRRSRLLVHEMHGGMPRRLSSAPPRGSGVVAALIPRATNDISSSVSAAQAETPAPD